MKKIAFIFLIYDKINYEKVWKFFFEDIEKSSYEIFIYSKNQEQLEYFEDYIIKYSENTSYMGKSIVTLQNYLIEKGLNKNCTSFVFLSGSCIPLKSFNYVYNFIDDNFSYFNICPDEQLNRIPNKSKEIIYKKSSQWSILCKKHGKLLVTQTDYLDWFDYPYISSDEHCYISKLYNLGLKHEIISTPNFSLGATTFTNWADVDYIYRTHKYGLKEYSYISQEEIELLIGSRSLFARKFLQNCRVSENLFLEDYLISKIKCSN